MLHLFNLKGHLGQLELLQKCCLNKVVRVSANNIVVMFLEQLSLTKVEDSKWRFAFL